MPAEHFTPPRGFNDLVGEPAERTAWAEATFAALTRSYGFAPVKAAPIGYAEMFEGFGSAAVGRIFDFTDRSGRRLALNADSLVVVLRALAGSGRLRSGSAALASASVPVARYRRNGRRGWSQAVAVICNEPEERVADLTLLRLWLGLFAALGEPATLEYCDYAVLDLVAAEHGLSPAGARAALHRRRSGDEAGNEEFLRRLDKLSSACRGVPAEAALAAMVAAEPATASRAAHLRSIFAVAGAAGARLSFNLDWDHATEYQSGLCFLTRTADGRTLGDGGGYHEVVRGLGLGADTCWSTSASVALMAELGAVPEPECVHLLRLPPVGDQEFLAAADRLRRAGYDVREHWRPRRLEKHLRRIPALPSHWFAVFGPRESATRTLALQNAAVVGEHRPFPLDQPLQEVSMNTPAPEPGLLAALGDRTAPVVVWGAGFIGLSAACALAVAGHPTAVVDIDAERVRRIAAGTVPLPGFEDRIPLAEALANGLRAVTPDDPATAGRVHLICVNTDRDGKPITGPLSTVLAAVADAVTGREALVVIESTVSPNWLDELVAPVFAGDAHASVHLATAPRRDWMLAADMNVRTLPRVAGARRPESREVLTELYGSISDQVHLASDWKHAALTKPVENLYRFVDLVLTNQLAEAYPQLDVPEVLRLAGTKWNVPVFHPSIGIGGYCIPLSPYFATGGVTGGGLPLVSSALDWNDTHPERVADAILAVADGPIGILGLSYAPNARITEGSPVRRITAHLLARGADVRVHDPYFTAGEITELTGAPALNWPEDAETVRTLVVATPHAAYDDLTSRLSALEKPPTVVDSLGVLRDGAADLPYAEWGTPAAPSAA